MAALANAYHMRKELYISDDTSHCHSFYQSQRCDLKPSWITCSLPTSVSLIRILTGLIASGFILSFPCQFALLPTICLMVIPCQL